MFYLFWRSLNEHSGMQGGIWALVLGAMVALVQFFLGTLIDPGGFGVSRWFSACIDIVGLPAALPFIVCLVCSMFKVIPEDADYTNLAFLWLIPVAALRALGWSALHDPLLLLGVPLMWTAIVTGMGFFLHIVQDGWGMKAIAAACGAAALPLAATTAYWAFFSQRTTAGFILLALTLVPALVSLVRRSIAEGRT